MRMRPLSGKTLIVLLSLLVAAVAAPAAADVFFTVGACRAYDSRDDVAGPLAFGTARPVQVTGVCGVPANASAVSLNETVISPSAAGWFFAFADTAPAGPVNGYPLRVNRNRGRVDIVAVGAGDSIGILACSGENPSACAGTGNTHVLVDINGYFVAGAVALPDAATVAEDSAPTAIDVLANDNDGGAGPFSIASATQPANGTVVLTGGSPGAHTGLTYQPNPNYCNTPPGTTLDTFTYTLNPSGSTTTVSVTVTCVDDNPVAVNDVATVAEDSGASAIAVLANDTDPDAGPISITGVTQPANGAVVITGGGTGLTYQPNANYCNTPPGTSLDTFTYTLTPGGSIATVTMTVTCGDDPPTAVADAATVAEDAPATAVNVLANDTDIDAGPMAVGSVTQPANGTVVITGGGTGLTYQPNANYCNTPPGTTLDTFTYTLTPGASSTTVTMTVTCADDPPVAVDDAATVAEDAPATAVPVLANDTDVDGGAISITSVTQPANGTVVITGGGTGLTYQPNANYCNNPPGTTLDTFTYTLTPGGDSATVAMTVTCVDDNPVAVNDAATVSEDSGANAVNVLANDTDVDAGPKSVTSVTQPANGTVVITGGGTGLTYQPNPNYCNTPPGTALDTFTYTLTPGGSIATVTMTVACIDDGPVAVADAATVAEDAPATAVTVLANDTDVDGGPISIVSVTQPANGAVVITGGGTGLTYQPNANYCNTPPGTTLDTFTYTLAPGGSSTTVSMSVTCVNDGPVVDLNGPTPAGTSFAVTFTEGDPPVLLEDGVDPDAATITDVDSTTIMSLTVTLTNLLDPTFEVLDANVTGFPSITKNYNTGTPGVGVLTLSAVTGQPIADFQSVLRTVTYRNTDLTPSSTARIVQFVANDGTNNGNTAVSTVTVVPVDSPPVAVADSATVAEDSGATAVAVLANDTDPDGGPISITSVTQPANGTVVITGGGTGLTYQPNANYCNTPPGTTLDTFTYTLTPGGSSTTVTMTVTCVDDNPVAVADAATVAEDSGASAIPVLTNDTDVDGGPKSITSVTQPANGTVVITGGGTGLTYQPNLNYCNTPPGTTLDTFTYTLTPGGSSTTVTMTVTCVDDNPVAVADAATVVEDSGANAINVLANDTDVDAGPKSVTSVTQPANGVVVITGGGTGLTYAPNANYCNNPPGTTLDTFTYTLTPGGSSTTVTMTVTCVDDPPVAVADSATVVEDSGANAINVLANDTDVDAGPKSVTSVTQPANGVVVITGGGTGLTYAPNANYCNNPPGTTLDTFTYTLTPGGSSTTVTMTVTCVNDPPVPDADLFDYLGNTQLEVDQDTTSNPEALETTPSTFGVVDGDSDPVEGNAIAVSAITVGGCTDSSAPFDCTDAGVGTVHMQTNGRFSFEPAPGDTGAAPTGCAAGAVDKETFTYTLTDNGTPSPASAIGTVTMCRFHRIWYVDPTAGGGGNGTSLLPLNALTALNGAGGAGDSDAAAEYIFIHDGTLAGTIEMESNQHLIGEGVALSIPVSLNGNGSPTLLVPAGTKPQVTNASGDTVKVTTQIPIEIVGLSLAGGTTAGGGSCAAAGTPCSAISLTTAAALTGSGTLTVNSNEFRGAGAEGIDVDLNAGTTGTLNLVVTSNSWNTGGTHTGNAVDINRAAATLNVNFSSNTNIVSNGNAVVIAGGAVANTTVTGFSSNTVHQNTGGAGVVMSNVTFDAVAGGAVTQVDGDNLAIGVDGDGVGGTAMSLSTVQGNLFFDDLDAYGGSGGLVTSGTGSGMTFAVTPSTSGGTSEIKASAGPAVDVTNVALDLRLAEMVSTTGAGGVNLNTVSGQFSVPTCGAACAITKASGGGTAFIVASSSVTAAYGGTLNVSSGGGVSLTSNTGSTAFSGALTISSGSSAAFAATGSGTVTSTDTTSTLATTTGTALNVANVTIGAADLTFRSISSNGASNGIVLNATGALGELIVAGNGGSCTSAGTCTGGAIQSSTGDGISLNNTRGPSFTRVFVGGSGTHGINAVSVNTGMTLANSYVMNSGNADNEYGLNISNVTGTATISGTTFDNAADDLVHFVNNNTNGNLTVNSSSSFVYPSSVSGTANSAIALQPNGTSNVTVTVQNSTFTNIVSSSINWGAATAGSNGTSTLNFSNNTITVNLAARGSGFALSGQESTTGNITISSNNFTGAGGNGVINIDCNDSSLVTGTVSSNTITTPPGIGMFIAVDEAAEARLTVNGNTITNSGGDGIQTVNFGGVGVSDLFLAITNNNVNGHSLNTGVSFVGGISYTGFEDNSCVEWRGNSVTGTPASPTQCGGAPCVDHYIEEVGGITTFEEVPNTASTTLNAAYINSTNDAGPVTIFGTIDLTNGAQCAFP